MSLVDKLKGAVGGLVLSAAVAIGGCVFDRGNERVIVPLPLVGLGAGVMSMKHEVYQDENRDKENIDYAVDSDVSATSFAAQMNISIYGEKRSPLWSYKARIGIAGDEKIEFYDSAGNKLSSFERIPSGLPVGVFFSNSTWINYTDRDGRVVNPERLTKIDPNQLRK